MSRYLISLPIDATINKAIKDRMRDAHLKRADVVRIALRSYFGLPGMQLSAQKKRGASAKEVPAA